MHQAQERLKAAIDDGSEARLRIVDFRQTAEEETGTALGSTIAMISFASEAEFITDAMYSLGVVDSRSTHKTTCLRATSWKISGLAAKASDESRRAIGYI